MSRREDISLPPDTRLGWGWHKKERDDLAPFRWASSSARIIIDRDLSLPQSLVLLACSPDPAIRHISVEVKGQQVKKEISHGWHYYEFQLHSDNESEDSLDAGTEIRISVTPPLLVEDDRRDLGVMVREIHFSEFGYCEYCRSLPQLDGDDLPEIVWLASFPRSGNTWMRFLLTHLLFKKPDKSFDIGRYIPDMGRPGELEKAIDTGDSIFEGLDGKKVIIVKTHDLFSVRRTLRTLPFRTAAAIYIIRNPLDVAASLAKLEIFDHDRDAFHKKFNLDLSEDERIADSINSMITYGTTRRTSFGNSGTWLSHVYSWLEVAQQESVPMHVIRFEDLKQDAYKQVRGVLNFLGLNSTGKQKAEAVEACAFARLKEMQEREIREQISGVFFNSDAHSQIRKGKRFLYKGETGTGFTEMTSEQKDDASKLFSKAMRKYGYI